MSPSCYGWVAALFGTETRVLFRRQLFVLSGSETPRSLDPLVAVMVAVTNPDVLMRRARSHHPLWVGSLRLVARATESGPAAPASLRVGGDYLM